MNEAASMQKRDSPTEKSMVIFPSGSSVQLYVPDNPDMGIYDLVVSIF